MTDAIVFFGTEEFSLAALEALVEANYPVAAVVTKPDRPQGRGLQVRPSAVKRYAERKGLRVLQPERVADANDSISAIPNRIGVLSSYGKIIPESTLALFDRGIVNIHPSLLPAYRGPSPIETAIFNGDAETGVSLMRLVAKMDAGPVYTQKTLPLSPSTRAKEMYTICAQTGSRLLIDSLPAILAGTLVPHAQDDERATYTSLLRRSDAVVDPAAQSAAQIERHIRAYELYPRTRLHLQGHDVILLDAHVDQNEAPGLAVRCADGAMLTIDRLIAPSGRSMSGADFLRGYGA